jgi:hypothetical protein
LALAAVASELDVAVAAEGAGKLMWAIGHDAVEVCSFGFLNDFQYFCSAVTGDGPEASFNWRSGTTSAAMVVILENLLGGLHCQASLTGGLFFFLTDTEALGLSESLIG